MQRREDNQEEGNRLREINLKIKAEAHREAKRLEEEIAGRGRRSGE